jgi:hypothetical protein
LKSEAVEMVAPGIEERICCAERCPETEEVAWNLYAP